ncbi:unnamed protein product [Closterium sp. NIES-64]|nr:unnamed protein product [Closterium sp. NIES-64]
MAAAINSATAEHSPLASTSHSPDCAFRHRSPSPCAATWSLPISHAASASASAMLLVLPDGSARLYTEELTVAQLACDFPDLVVSCTAPVAHERSWRRTGQADVARQAAGVVGGTAVDRPVEVCHVAVPAGRATEAVRFAHGDTGGGRAGGLVGRGSGAGAKAGGGGGGRGGSTSRK